MTKAPSLKGVPSALIEYWLEELKAGRMAATDQRELHKVLLHKWTGTPGEPPLTSRTSKRQLDAAILAMKVKTEVRRRTAAGEKPGHGGHRAAALDTMAERYGWRDGEALGKWLQRNGPTGGQ